MSETRQTNTRSIDDNKVIGNSNKIVNSNTELVVYKTQDQINTVCKIIEKSYEANKKCLLLCNNEEEIDLFDNKLWTYSKLSFIPHGSKYSVSISNAIHCNTWISDELVYVNNPNYLINLGCTANNIQHNFTKIIDITCNLEDNLDIIRSKYNVEFSKCTIWIQSNNKWIKSNGTLL